MLLFLGHYRVTLHIYPYRIYLRAKEFSNSRDIQEMEDSPIQKYWRAGGLLHTEMILAMENYPIQEISESSRIPYSGNNLELEDSSIKEISESWWIPPYRKYLRAGKKNPIHTCLRAWGIWRLTSGSDSFSGGGSLLPPMSGLWLKFLP